MVNNKGLTLIEILIAIVVLMIGLVGILALFPTGLKSAKETEEDSHAAIMADSICQALQAAMRMPTVDPSTGDSLVKMSHDGLPRDESTTNECIYEICLPTFVESLAGFNDKPRLYAHPESNDANATIAYRGTLLNDNLTEPEFAFRLGNNLAIYEVYKDVISGPDSTDPYTQYAFAFTVMRVDDLDPDMSDPDRRARPLFEFKIYIYRLRPIKTDANYTPPAVIVESVSGRKPKQVFTVQISGL